MWLILLATLTTATPAELHAAALGDLVTAVPPERRIDTRYVSLNAAADGPDRDTLYSVLLFALNSTSFRSSLTRPPRVYRGELVRLDLASLGWDQGSRTKRIARLAGQSVDVSSFKADLWDEITRTEPYYFTVAALGNGLYRRGWVDPAVDEQLRTATYAAKGIVRADWLVRRILLESDYGGVYSQALLLPPKESDLYKAFGVDAKLVNSDPQLRSGGAVLDSIVALHNRELQLIPSLYGHDERFIWLTFDFSKDETGARSVVETLAGTVKHDGREIIGTLPNGLHWYFLSNGAGTQVAVVPQDIAIDQRSVAAEKIKDRSVINSYKCISCHGPVSGIYPFEDVISKAVLAPGIGLAVIAKGKERQSELRSAIEDYYLTGIAAKIARQEASYAARVTACNGLQAGPNSVAVNRTVEGYLYDLVTAEQAAREMGQPLPVATIQWRNSGNANLVVLSSGQAIRRAAWEASFADSQLATTYPWDIRKP